MDTGVTGGSRLFSGLELGGIRLGNRLAVAPMTRASANGDGTATARMAAYYASFARGGFGLIFSEGVYPDEAHGQGYVNQPRIANRDQVEAWRAVTGAVHAEGVPIFAQLMHAGALSQYNRFRDNNVAPSRVQPRGEQMEAYGGSGRYAVPVELSREGIWEIVEEFAAAAVRARDAGFDGIEIHGANGYLIDQFLTDYTNGRTDEYGGPVENRVRFGVEVIQAVREAVGEGYPVGIRISQGKVNDYEHKWAGDEAEAAVVFRSYGEAGVDYIHVTEFEATKPAFGEGPTFAALARKYGGVQVIANGTLENPDVAEELLKAGEADVIALGKGALSNMDWPNRVSEGLRLRPFDPEVLGSLKTL